MQYRRVDAYSAVVISAEIVHEITGSNPVVMHKFSNCFENLYIHVYTRIYAYIHVYDSIHLHILVYQSIYVIS